MQRRVKPNSFFIIFSLFFAIGIQFLACNQGPNKSQSRQNAIAIPVGFTIPEYPEDNLPTEERLTLGKKLFFETALSRDSTISCATCHIPAKAFADNQKISVGIKGRSGFRNVPSLGNIGYHPYFFREGGNPTLEMQMLGPIQDHDEMDLTIYEAIERLKKDPAYAKMSDQAFGREFDAYVLSRSIAAFERSLITGNSPFDRFHFQKDSTALSESQQRGMDLFFSAELACSNCHSGQDFSDYSMQNIGLYEIYTDEGLTRVTTKTEDIGKFKVPSLRNAGLTAPYMHDGSLPDLKSVIEHYDKGGNGHQNQSPMIRPLNLTEGEKQDLIAFLEALTDLEFVTNNQFLPGH
ncbi:MAG: cytochrome c peroxidase [Bacteroidota bacterium]